MEEWPPDSGEYMCGGCGVEDSVTYSPMSMKREENADTYEGERVTYSCGSVLLIERVHPRSFSICKKCEAKYPNVITSERVLHESGVCVGMEQQKIEPVKTERPTREIVKTMIGEIPFYSSGGEEE